MTRTSFDLDETTGLMVIKPAFECSIAPGRHILLGDPGEHVFQILGRWMAINFPGLDVGTVQQTGALTWACRTAAGQHVQFTILI